MRLPFDANGFAPSMTSRSVWSMSGIGMVMGVPNISPADTCFGIWSTVLAEKTFVVARPCRSALL